MIVLTTLEPLLLELLPSEEELGALERRFDRRLEASEVSPDSNSFSSEVRALSSGLDVLDLWVLVGLVALE